MFVCFWLVVAYLFTNIFLWCAFTKKKVSWTQSQYHWWCGGIMNFPYFVLFTTYWHG
jgi:hypothetical protein